MALCHPISRSRLRLADALLTHNLAQYDPARRFGIPVVTPRDFLGTLRANI